MWPKIDFYGETSFFGKLNEAIYIIRSHKSMANFCNFSVKRLCLLQRFSRQVRGHFTEPIFRFPLIMLCPGVSLVTRDNCLERGLKSVLGMDIKYSNIVYTFPISNLGNK